MGGPGSGRRGFRPLVERAVRIDVAAFDGRGAFESEGYGSFEWPSVDDLVFEFKTSPDGLVITSPVEVVPGVVVRTTSTGGRYRLWLCPHCHSARKHVYVALGSDTLACRECLGLTYRRSNLSGTRVTLAAWKRNRAKQRLDDLQKATEMPNARRGRRRVEAIRRWRDELVDAEAELEAQLNYNYRRMQRRLRKGELWNDMCWSSSSTSKM